MSDNLFDYDYDNMTKEEALDLLAWHTENKRLHGLAQAHLTTKAYELCGYDYDFEECPEVEAIINPQDDDDGD